MKETRESDLPAKSAAWDAVLPAPRKTYAKPTLQRLGSVRDLVLGQSAGFPEGAGTFRRPVR